MSALVETSLRADTALVADLGGTHLRLGLVQDGQLAHHRVHRWSEEKDFATAVEQFVGDAAVRAACFAVAAPVDGDLVRLTNAAVSFSRAALQHRLGVETLLVVNDVAALARSVTSLRSDDVVHLGGGGLRPDRTIAVVAPGTGLGVAALVPTDGGPIVVSGEGGHAPLPATAAGIEVAAALLSTHGHVTVEDLVCGPGLVALDVVLRTLRGEPDLRPRTGSAVSASGETAPGQVLDVFVDLLAAVAQAHAFSFGARGGVVLGGGFLRHLVPLLQELRLHERFVRHPTMSSYLESVPLVLDTRECPALHGAASLLQDLT